MKIPADYEHTYLVYRDHRELQRVLVEYVRASIASNYTTVFVHHFEDDARAAEFLHDGGLPPKQLLDDRLILIAGRNAAFQDGGPMIDATHVAKLVTEIVTDSERRERAGVRLFADAAKAYIEEGRDNEWFRFESWLGRRLQHRVGLVCAYPSALLPRGSVRKGMDETHSGGIWPPGDEVAARP